MDKSYFRHVHIALFPLVTVALASVFVLTGADTSSSLPSPPVAKKEAKVTDINGHKLVDNYFWLRDKKNPDAKAYLDAENVYTDAVMKPTELMHKKSTFTDFIFSAEYLLTRGYGSKDRLVIEGRSAGGLLMGAVLNMRPDLFHAALVGVPFVDVMNTMLDGSIPLTLGEFEEWGNPKEKPASDCMLTYSPYDNIEPRAYPNMLVRTSFNDSQVGYWEPAKYVARMRALCTDHNVLILKTKMNPAGQGGAAGCYDRLHENRLRLGLFPDPNGNK
jgi:oligopeptidase B